MNPKNIEEPPMLKTTCPNCKLEQTREDGKSFQCISCGWNDEELWHRVQTPPDKEDSLMPVTHASGCSATDKVVEAARKVVSWYFIFGEPNPLARELLAALFVSLANLDAMSHGLPIVNIPTERIAGG